MRALVLRKQVYSETDLIVEFLTEQGSLLRAFARGAKRSRKRFPHQFHPAGLYEIELAKKAYEGRLNQLAACELKSFYSSLELRLENWARWAMVQEWICLNEGGQHIFEDVVQVLSSLAEKDVSEIYYEYFVEEIQRQGLQPELKFCLHCGLANDLDAFSLSQGGVTHARCESHAIKVSEGALCWLRNRFGGRDEPELAFDWGVLDQILIPFLQFQMGRSLKAFRFFQQTGPGDLQPQRLTDSVV